MLKHNFINALVVIAGGVMATYYSAVIRVNSGCPMLIASGPSSSETGKSTVIQPVLALTGKYYTCFCMDLSRFPVWEVTVLV